MVVTCDIQFEDNPQGCYFAGQLLTGKITLSADKIKQVKAVVLKINGFAQTSWSEKDSDDKSTDYHGRIDYINSLTYLLSPTAPEEAVVIEPGIHSFSFACHIPTNCPSSFEAIRGHIRYVIQVNLVRPWKFDQTFTRGFTVLKVADLNYDTPMLKIPACSVMSKAFCCGPLKTDPLQMRVELPHSGYVPGENIPVSILVTNDTKAQINEICVRLVMTVWLYSQTPRFHAVNDAMTISKLIGDPVPVLCKKQFHYLLPVPATAPSCSNLCSIIQVAYRIEVEAKIQGIFYANQVIHTAVTIGNVPLSGVIQQQPLPTRGRVLNSDGEDQNDSNVAQEGELSNSQPWSGNDDIPCPVFMEASFMPHAKLADAAKHDYGEESFSPKYPVFNISSRTIEANEDNSVPPIVTDPNKSTWL